MIQIFIVKIVFKAIVGVYQLKDSKVIECSIQKSCISHGLISDERAKR